MKRYVIMAMVLFLSASLVAQKRYLVSSRGDVVPVPKGKSALTELRKIQKTVNVVNSAATCTPTQTFGNQPQEHTVGQYFRFQHGHKDLMAIWYEAPTSGTIDSIYIQTGSDSLAGWPGKLIARVHRSNIYTGNGPGWGPYMAPPKTCWGYFNNSSDLDMGIAAFPDDATDTTWHSSYAMNNSTPTAIAAHHGELVDTTLPTFPPAAEEIWGLGGVEFVVHPSTTTAIDLSALPPKPEVTKGFPFFITFRVPGDHPDDYSLDPAYTDPTTVDAFSNNDGLGESASAQNDGDPRPEIRRNFHNWKFYEHPLYCGVGWIARGDCSLFIWYVMTATGDVPPLFTTIDQLGNTISEGSTRLVQADIADCNFEPSGSSGVNSATLTYSVDNGPDNIISMTNIGGTIWQTDIPDQTCPDTVRYRLTATDINGNTSSSITNTYRTLCVRNDWYIADTGAVRTSGSIANDGGHNAIDTSAWFAPSDPGANIAPKDDGTAGPFPINPGFIYFGDTLHYAWIGTNGGIALSKTANDTINVNSDGSYNSWTIPGNQRLPFPDTTNYNGIPRNFIGGFWADLIVGDTVGKYGNVYWKDEIDRFVVEWDSIGVFEQATGNAIPDEEVFRIVLNKLDGTLEFQYDNVGNNALDQACLVALQSDVTDSLLQQQGWHLINQNTYPYETKPRNDWCLKYWPIIPTPVNDGWNMVSVAGTSPSNAKTYLYPKAASSAFYYEAGYKSAATMSNGVGYWLKFNGSQTADVPAGFHNTQDVTLGAKWNMIGSVTNVVPTGSITSTPLDLVQSPYYGYNGGYAAVTVLDPGKAYWVKASDAGGTLHMNASSALPKAPASVDQLNAMNTITLHGNGSQTLYLGEQSLVKSASFYELPPAPPAGIFDARFTSQQMVETYPATMENGKQYQYAIQIQSETYPVTVQWNIGKQPDGRTFVMCDNMDGKALGNTILSGTGSIQITNSAVKTLVVKLVEGVSVPNQFALSKNYPNPFNPTTRISVEMPVSAEVEVAVYDILGQKVTTLLSGQQSAGYHTVEWNGTNQAGLTVPSGAYFIRMISGDFSAIQKVMMMK